MAYRVQCRHMVWPGGTRSTAQPLQLLHVEMVPGAGTNASGPDVGTAAVAVDAVLASAVDVALTAVGIAAEVAVASETVPSLRPALATLGCESPLPTAVPTPLPSSAGNSQDV